MFVYCFRPSDPAKPLQAPWGNTENIRPPSASGNRTYTAAGLLMNPTIADQLDLQRRGLSSAFQFRHLNDDCIIDCDDYENVAISGYGMRMLWRMSVN